MMRWLLALLLVPLLLAGGCGRYLYGAEYESAFLTSCEQRSTASYCGCALDWMERTMSPAQVEYAVATYQQTGQRPDSMQLVATICSLGQILY